MTTSNYVLFSNVIWAMLNTVKGKNLVWIFVFMVMLVNFCFQVVVVGRLLWEQTWTFDVVLKYLSACFLRSQPHLGNTEFDERKKLGVNICFHRNISHVLISSCRGRTPSLRTHLNFWCSFKVPERLLFAFTTSFGQYWIRWEEKSWCEYLFSSKY